MSRLLFLSFLLLSQICVFAQERFEFVPNGGQWHPNVKYKADVPSGALFMEQNALTYSLYESSFFHNLHEGHDVGDKLKFHSFKIEFVGAKTEEIELKWESEGEINYFLGDDPSKWAAGLKAGGMLVYHNLYDGIDFQIYTDRDGKLKSEFIVTQDGDYEEIRMKFTGLDELFLDEGALNMVTSLGTLIEQKPITFNGPVTDTIPSRYIVEGNEVSFWVENVNDDYFLVIDPVLIFSTYSGSVANNFGYTATYDDKGYLYAGGSVFSQGYPTTTGAFDVTFNSYATTDGIANFSGWYWGISDIGITKYNLNGTSRVYSTYIGGLHCEVPHSLVVNNRDELFILGSTSSFDYPVSASAFDNSFGGGTQFNLARGVFNNYTEGSDIIVSRLSKNGDALLASTFVGGSQNDGLNVNVDLVANYADQMRGEIILDKNQNVIVGSSTVSADFPITLSAYQNTYGGGDQDGVVFKMNEDLSTMLWSSYFGGAGSDGIYSVITSNDNNIYFAGGTNSSDLNFPVSAYQSAYQGGITDGYYVKLSDDGTSVLNGSYFGSDAYDQIYFVREDRDDQVYFFGQSDKYGTYWIQNATYNEPNSGQFISKMALNQQSLDWSTTFGSGNNRINISPTAFMVDLCNKVYLSGWGSPSSGFDQIGGNVADGTAGMEVTSDAYKLTTDNNDFYLMVLEDDASALFYASFFGGDLSSEHVDGGTSRFDSKGVMYQSVCAGCGGNDDFPIFPSNVVGPTNEGIFIDLNNNQYPFGCNNGVFKFDFGIPNIIADFQNPPILCAPATIQFKDNSKVQNQTTWNWDFGDGTFSTDTNPTHTYSTAGVYTVKLVIQDPTACNLIDSISKTLTVMGGNVFDLGVDSACVNTGVQIGLTPYADTAITYAWTPNIDLSNSTISNPIAEVNKARDYLLIIQNSTCADTVKHSVFPFDSPFNTNDTIGCKNSTSNLVFDGFGKFEEYLWSSTPLFLDTLSPVLTDSFVTVNVPNSPQDYYVRAKDVHGCVVQDTLRLFVAGLKYGLADSLICFGDTIQLGDSINSQFVQVYNWEPVDSIISQVNSLATVSPRDTTVFTLFKDFGIGCEDTVFATVFVPYNPPGMIADSLVCNESNISLKGDTNSVFQEFIWSSNSSYSDTISSSNNLFTSIVEGGNDFYLKYKDAHGCEYYDSVSVTSVVFELQTTSDSVVCQTLNGNASIINYTASRFDSILWQPFNKISGDSTSLSVVLNAGQDLNRTWVYAMDTNGCEDVDTVIILNLSVAGADLPDTSICLGDSITIGINFDNTKGVTFEWIPTTGLSNPNISNPKTWAADTIEYGLIIDNGVCRDTFYQTINASEVGVKAFGDTVVCNYNGGILLSDSSKTGLIHHWSTLPNFSDTLKFGLDSSEYIHISGSGVDSFYVAVFDELGCSAVDTVVVSQYSFDINYAKEIESCWNDTIEITPQGHLDYDSVGFVWAPGSSLISGVNDTSAVVSLDPGTHEITVQASSAYGCVDHDTIQVTVGSFDTSWVELTASFDTLIKGEYSVLTALPKGMVYSWNPSSGILSTDSNTATVEISKSTVYTVLISDSIVPGCFISDSIQLTFIDAICGEPYIFVPNAFTPNGDGENDVLFVRGRNITELYFAIYNRWGQKVFETKEQSIGWDGTYNGMSVDPAVFDYYLKYRCDDQEEHFMKGNITIIR